MLRRCVATAVLPLTVACGHPPPLPAPPATPARQTPPAPRSVEPPTVIVATTKTNVDRERDFLDSCSGGLKNSAAYCDCAWAEFRAAFSEEEMAAGILPAPRLEKLKARVLIRCASKVDEPRARARFGDACAGDNPALDDFCACTWSELRKRFSAAELNDDATAASERVLSARPPVIKSCGSKMPESASRAAFMKGCTTDASVDSFCDCVWKELRKQASPAQIESGTFDQKSLFGQVEKTCGTLRPAKP